MNVSDLNAFLQQPAFSLPQAEKELVLLKYLNELTQFHRQACEGYRRITDHMLPPTESHGGLSSIPYLPTTLFKYRQLRSVPQRDIRTTIKSSGTGGVQSQIELDAESAKAASKALGHTLSSITQGQRLPMLIIDHEAALPGGPNIGARASAILGLMPYGTDHTFVLREDLTLDHNKLAAFLRKHRNQKVLIFGFTFLVWEKFISASSQEKYDLSNSILLHSGGWKKLQQSSVDNDVFKACLKEAWHIDNCINFYGMAELPGTVFLENSDGLLTPPHFADVLIRDPHTFKVLPQGQVGLVQILSVVPRSYPGHSLLTEDMGVVETVDSGVQGRYGKGFRIMGRAPRAEMRGCSDVLALGGIRE